jgi:SAM-dependent methyltransferase
MKKQHFEKRDRKLLTTLQSDHNLWVLRDELSSLTDIGYGNLNYDALYKWATILYNVKSIWGKSETELKILDIGGGLGPLDQLFTKFGEVWSIDIKNDRSTWFPVSKAGFYDESKGFEFNNDRLQRICLNFWDIDKKFEPETFDIIYDSCSMIHFSHYGKNKDTPQSVFKSSRLVKKLLKPDGIFVVASDVASSNTYEFNDMIFAGNLDLAIRSAGFRSINPFNINISTNNPIIASTRVELPGYKSRGILALPKLSESRCGLISHKYKNGRARVQIEVIQAMYEKTDDEYLEFEFEWKKQSKSVTLKNKVKRFLNYADLVLRSRLKKVFR